MTTKTIVTIKEATQRWVNEFNAIPQALIERAYPSMDGLEILCTDKECSNCGSTDFSAEGAEEEGGEDILTCMSCGSNDFSEAYGLPMWGTMWTVSSYDSDWIKENLEIVRECGFWVYESDELDVLLGINGAGYDFYESHWIPFYNARGLKWHTEV